MHVDYLILGAGWTSTFLIPLLERCEVTYASTSTTGRLGTIQFKYDPDDSDPAYFSILPSAKNIIIVFPLNGVGSSRRLISHYHATHPNSSHLTRFVQLGSSGIYQIPSQPLWIDRSSSYDTSKPRAIAEDELLSLGGCVLNLSGLWGGSRHPRNWISKVGSTKSMVEGKTSLHLIHGEDVALSIYTVCSQWDDEVETDKGGETENKSSKTRGQRYLITDGFVYDWWSLFVRWSHSGDTQASATSSAPHATTSSLASPQSRWVFELMQESSEPTVVRALPRSPELLGRCYDSREFWSTFGIAPERSGLE
jgi:hypothetical protein